MGRGGLASSLLSQAPARRRQHPSVSCGIKEPPAAFGVTVPHGTAAPGGGFGVGRGLNAGKASVLGEAAELPTQSQQVGSCPHPWPCRWEMGTLLSAAPGLERGCRSRPALRGLFAVENAARREGQDWDPVPYPVCVSQRARTLGYAGKTRHRFLGSLSLLWDTSG